MTTIRMSANAAASPRGCPEMRVCAVVIAHSECMQGARLSSGNGSDLRCSESSSQGQALTVDAIQAIQERLEREGFAINRDLVGGHDVLVARRAKLHWTLSRLHVFVIVFELPDVDASDAEQLTAAARAYAIDHKGGLPRGVQNGVASMPIIVVPREARNALEWARGEHGRHWAALDFPVVIERSTGVSAFRQKRELWGSAYFPQLYRLANDLIAAATMETASARPVP